MSKRRLLEEKVGGWWTGVRFHFDGSPEPERRQEPMRFCEAVRNSRTRPIVLTAPVINCPGALRSLGLSDNQEETMAVTMAEKAGLAPETARKLITGTPRLRSSPTGVTVGTDDDSDMFVSFAQPAAAMRLLRNWQGRTGKPLVCDISSVMAVCGSVAVKSYLTNRLCISFGCPDSREYGAIGRDQLVVGVPAKMVEEIV